MDLADIHGLHPELVHAAIDRLEAKHRRNPGDPQTRRRLASFLRQAGATERAATLLHPIADEDLRDRWTRAVCAGTALPSARPPGELAVPHIVINDVLAPAELDQTWRLIDRLTPTMRPATTLGEAATGIREASVAHDLGAIGTDFLNASASLVRDHAHRLGPDALTLRSDGHEVQLTAHGDNGRFHPHQDRVPGTEAASRAVTFVWHLHRTPARFSGGDLLLFDTDPQTQQASGIHHTRLRLACNSMILFPSWAWHQVTPVHLDSDDPLDQRFTVNGWLHGPVERRRPDG